MISDIIYILLIHLYIDFFMCLLIYLFYIYLYIYVIYNRPNRSQMIG